MCLSPIGILRANHVIKPPPAVKIQRHFVSNGPLRCLPARLRLPSRPTRPAAPRRVEEPADPKGNTDGFIAFPAL
jgi:hypothetical protein